MYWADWSRNRPKIEVANMDGTDRRIVVNSQLSLPNGLTIVHSTNELCYSDAGMWAISCVNLGDLSMRKAYNPAPYPFGITNFNRTLFWTDWTLGRIQRMGMNSKFPDKPLRSFVGSNGKIFHIKAVQPCGRIGKKWWRECAVVEVWNIIVNNFLISYSFVLVFIFVSLLFFRCYLVFDQPLPSRTHVPMQMAAAWVCASWSRKPTHVHAPMDFIL